MVRMKRGNGSMLNTNNDGEANLTKAFRDFQLYLNRKLYVIEYMDGRAKYPTLEKGVISLILADQILNEKRYYALHFRSYFWDKWRQAVNLLTVLPQPLFKYGFTITKNIYDELIRLNQETETELIIRLPELIYWYKISTLEAFVKKYNPVSENRNDMDRPLEYGFPALGLERKEAFFEGKEVYHPVDPK